jgi:Bromodomain extra-terminal - transcription regulation
MDYVKLSGGESARNLTKKPSVNSGSGNMTANGMALGQPSPFYGNQAEMEAIAVIKKNCEEVFKLLKSHQAYSIFTDPIDFMNPISAQLKNEGLEHFNLLLIENNYRQNKYTSTFQLGKDMRNMWIYFTRFHQADPVKINLIKDIQTYFDRIYSFYNLENQSLVPQAPPAPVPPQQQKDRTTTHPQPANSLGKTGGLPKQQDKSSL